MAPEKIGRYEIRAELGRGGMATVYHGYDPRFEREVAVKVLPSELLHSDPQFKLRFEREAKIIAQLEHPSIVPVYDVGDEGGQPYFVMRYMNGGSLSERIKNKVMSVQDAAKILGQIAPGLDEAHAKGIVHRDLKPSNILFDSKGTPYISDFGIAKLSQSQASSVTGSGIIGTPAYMAPEQASGEGVDGRSDIYALGIILFEMLTGRQPYEADTPMAVAIKHITDPVPRILEANPNLPPDVENIIQVAMAKSKNDRFSTSVELVDALRNIDSPAIKTEMRTRALKATAKIPALERTKVGAHPANKPFNVWMIIIPLIVLGLIGGGYFVWNSINSPVETEAVPTSTSAPLPTATVEQATEEPVVPVEPTEAPTDTPAPPTDTPAPQFPVLGGADKIAFVANNEIWLMNVDGTELTQLTFDGATKNDLQWLDRDTILFLSGKIIKFHKLSTGVTDILTSFNSAVTLDAFRVSNDGTQVMIAMSNEIFVAPFDFERMKTIKSRGTFFDPEQKTCILPVGGTKAAFAVREARWSADGKLVAWLYKGVVGTSLVSAEQIMVLDVTACDPTKIDIKDNFPGERFTPVGYQSRILTDFDWDGNELFAFNTSVRNEGWGELYLYNWITHKPTQIRPINGACCYRDARWSPDGTYLFFAFQDIGLAAAAPNVLYYVPAGVLEAGGNFEPLPLPEGFIRNPREDPQAALRPAE